jgi:hypothetical protein
MNEVSFTDELDEVTTVRQRVNILRLAVIEAENKAEILLEDPNFTLPADIERWLCHTLADLKELILTLEEHVDGTDTDDGEGCTTPLQH